MAFDLENNIKFIHVVAVTIWISVIPIELVLKRLAEKAKEGNTDSVLIFAKMGFYATICAIVVFLTGGFMAGANWFKFGGGGTWLALKQIFFLVAFTIGIVFANKAGNQLTKMVKEAKPKDELIAQMKKLSMISHTIMGFVFINLYLAIVKPF